MAGHPPISQIPETLRQEFLDDLNYLNLSEIKTFCRRCSIPYTIVIETTNGRIRTHDEDRKGVILDRIRSFLQTGVVPEETCFRSGVICFDPLPEPLGENDRLFYGQYDKNSPSMDSLLKRLTGGKFRNGAIASILAREFWARGEAPTFKAYADAWLKALEGHTAPNPEWAFLSDRARRTPLRDWKTGRARKAARVIARLDRIA